MKSRYLSLLLMGICALGSQNFVRGADSEIGLEPMLIEEVARLQVAQPDRYEGVLLLAVRQVRRDEVRLIGFASGNDRNGRVLPSQQKQFLEEDLTSYLKKRRCPVHS